MKFKNDLLKQAWKRLTDKWGKAIQHVPVTHLKAEMDSEVLYALVAALRMCSNMEAYQQFVTSVMDELNTAWENYAISRE